MAFDQGIAELHLQAWGTTAETMLRCGEALAALSPGRVAVKVPVTATGVNVARALIDAAVPVTFTACYEPHQVLIAAALGARYIAPYLGRIRDQGREGLAEVIAMQRSLVGMGSSVRLLVASLRQPEELQQLAGAGVNTFTIGAELAATVLHCEASEAAAAQFERDAQC